MQPLEKREENDSEEEGTSLQEMSIKGALEDRRGDPVLPVGLEVMCQ